MGQNKLLLTLGDQRIIEKVLSFLRASSVQEILCILPANASAWWDLVKGPRTEIVVNPDPAQGRTSSVKVGVRNLNLAAEGFVIVSGDMPLIQPETVDQVLEAACQSDEGIAVATFQGRKGHPVAFHARFKEAILGLSDSDPLHILTRGPHRRVPTEDPGVVCNLNTWEDYQSVQRQTLA